MPKNVARQEQIAEDTITGADLNDKIGIYDETDNYSSGDKVIWNSNFYVANTNITATTEGDLSSTPDISSDWDLSSKIIFLDATSGTATITELNRNYYVNTKFNDISTVTIPDASVSTYNKKLKIFKNKKDGLCQYTNNSYDASTQLSNSHGVFINNAGFKMYIIDVNGVIFEYDLSTEKDITTATYNGNSFNTHPQDSTMADLFFSNNGFKLYVPGLNNTRIFEYDLTVAWDITTAIYNSNSFDVSGMDNTPVGLSINEYGTKLIFIGQQHDTLYECSFGTPFDISTLSYTGNSLDISAQVPTPLGMSYNNDILYVSGQSTLCQYKLSSSFDLSSNIDFQDTMDISAQSSWPQGIFADDENLYVVDQGSNSVFDYALNVGVVNLKTTSNQKIVNEKLYTIAHEYEGIEIISNDTDEWLLLNSNLTSTEEDAYIKVKTTSDLSVATSIVLEHQPVDNTITLVFDGLIQEEDIDYKVEDNIISEVNTGDWSSWFNNTDYFIIQYKYKKEI